MPRRPDIDQLELARAGAFRCCRPPLKTFARRLLDESARTINRA
jgi:hypothetical protein